MARKKKLDRRAQRTRHSLTHAMVELVTEKRFDDITVQNLIDRADIGRSTFYSHFRDKEDLFQKNWEAFIDFCAQQIIWDKAGKGSYEIGDVEGAPSKPTGLLAGKKLFHQVSSQLRNH